MWVRRLGITLLGLLLCTAFRLPLTPPARMGYVCSGKCGSPQTCPCFLMQTVSLQPHGSTPLRSSAANAWGYTATPNLFSFLFAAMVVLQIGMTLVSSPFLCYAVLCRKQCRKISGNYPFLCILSKVKKVPDDLIFTSNRQAL